MDDMTCDQVEDLLPELLDGAVEAHVLDSAVHHIATCDACTLTKGQYDSMQALYRNHGALRLTDETRTRIRASLEN